MKHGVVGIRGVKTGLYLCMSGDGLAYGAVGSPVCTAHSSDTAWFKGTVYLIQTVLFMMNCPHIMEPKHTQMIWNVFSRCSFLTTACWRRTWRRITTPPTPLWLTRASIWLCPTRESSGRATVWAPTSPAPTSCLGGQRDQGPLTVSFFRTVRRGYIQQLGLNKRLKIVPQLQTQLLGLFGTLLPVSKGSERSMNTTSHTSNCALKTWHNGCLWCDAAAF